MTRNRALAICCLSLAPLMAVLVVRAAAPARRDRGAARPVPPSHAFVNLYAPVAGDVQPFAEIFPQPDGTFDAEAGIGPAVFWGPAADVDEIIERSCAAWDRAKRDAGWPPE